MNPRTLSAPAKRTPARTREWRAEKVLLRDSPTEVVTMLFCCHGLGLKSLVCLLDNLGHTLGHPVRWICDLHDRNITNA